MTRENVSPYCTCFNIKKLSQAYIGQGEFFFDVSEAVVARRTFPRMEVPLYYLHRVYAVA